MLKQRGISYTKERFYKLLTHQSDEVKYSVLEKILELENDARNTILGFIVEWDGKGNMKEIVAVVATDVLIDRYEFESNISLVKVYPPA